LISSELHYLIEAAHKEALNRRHIYFCVEHLLYAVIHDTDCIKVISNVGGSIEKLKNDIEKFFDNEIEKDTTANSKFEIYQTDSCVRVIQDALRQVHSSGKKEAKPIDILIAIFGEEESHASFFLLSQGVTKLDILNYISHGISKIDDDNLVYSSDESNEDSKDSSKQKSPLEKYTENLTNLAKLGSLDPLIGREPEVNRAIRVLARRQKNNPLFIGDPGVGKTSIVNGIALKIVTGEVPEVLKDAQIYSLHVGALVAGTKFRGEFEERLRAIVKQLGKDSILFIDEIHQVVGAGATGSGSMDAANLLKPALQSGLRCIGSTTYEDYKKSFEKDRALSRRFSVIDVKEPSIPDTIDIIKGLLPHYEKFHSVKYTLGAIKSAATLSAKYINGRLLPDKAIDVIDEAGATNSILPVNKRKETISEKDIEQVVSLMAKVPIQSVSRDDALVLKNLESRLKKIVFGQDSAITSIVKAVKRSRATLTDERKPIGCFLFAGPTGVGKTELSKALASELGISFNRFDMSEYMEKHTVARLVGAPPGYVGYEEGGQLTDLIRKNPYCVLLLDEIEKAHPDIYNILLQVMDDARLTDSQGKESDFRNVILIMTTNAGSEKSSAVGFGSAVQNASRDEAIKRLFKPEFRNRLDEVIFFNPLPRETLRSIVEKFIEELNTQLSTKKVKLDIDESAINYLSEKGFDPVLGARPMKRLIQREIKDAITDELLFGKLIKGGTVKVTYPGEALKFEYNN
jgi:ATP-dependent Clp protease ATP-binding subunit ClpA